VKGLEREVNAFNVRVVCTVTVQCCVTICICITTFRAMMDRMYVGGGIIL
jgi:hypothetical protein